MSHTIAMVFASVVGFFNSISFVPDIPKLTPSPTPIAIVSPVPTSLATVQAKNLNMKASIDPNELVTITNRQTGKTRTVPRSELSKYGLPFNYKKGTVAKKVKSSTFTSKEYKLPTPTPETRINVYGNSGSYTRVGNFTFGSDGSTYNQVGNTTFGSDGSTYQRVGNTVFGNDGSTYQKVGNTTFGSNGSSYTTIGNTNFGSDGSTSTNIGNTTFYNP